MENLFIYNLMIGLCIIASAFFSGIETAIISARRLTIETLHNKGHRGASRSLYILDHVEEAIGMVLIGNNVANITAAAFITYILTQGFLLRDSYIIIATIIQTLFFLIFCEIIPKIFSKSKAESFLIFFSYPLVTLMFILRPPVKLSLYFTELLKRRMNIDIKRTGILNSREDITTFFSIGHKEGILDIQNQFYVSEILSFKETHAYEVMIPFANAVSIEAGSPVKDLVALIEKTKFSRIPVYRDEKENIIGYVYYRDILKGGVEKITDILIQPVFIPETKNIFELYNEMSRRRTPMLFVVNEYGDISGLLTFEDIAEEIVGDIDTSDHTVEESIVMINERKYLLSGKLDIDYFMRYFGVEIRKKHFETLAGFLMSIHGDIPEKGDHIKYENCEFIIEETGNRTVEKVIMMIPRRKKTAS